MSIWRWEVGTIMRTWREKKANKLNSTFIHQKAVVVCFFTLCSCILVLFSRRSISAWLLEISFSLSASLPFCSSIKPSMEKRLVSSCCSMDFMVLAGFNKIRRRRGESVSKPIWHSMWKIRCWAGTRAGTCFAVFFQHHLLDPVSVLQSLDQPGQGDVIVGVGQLGGG